MKELDQNGNKVIREIQATNQIWGNDYYFSLPDHHQFCNAQYLQWM